jgi:tetratricopeptide (TPR) repeat protein
MTRNKYQGRLADLAIAQSQKDTAGLIRGLTELITVFPDSSTPAISLASYYATTKRNDDAFRILEDRLRRSPNDVAALYQFGRLAAITGSKLDRGQTSLEKFLKLPRKKGTPSVAGAHWRLGMIFEARGDTARARSEYQTAMRLDPKLEGPKGSLDRLQK